MNRINKIFENQLSPLLNIYFTAGYPNLDSTFTLLKALENAGADCIEIGMPYSDPLADGNTIQNSSQIALQNGMSLKVLFSQLQNLRPTIKIPVILMGYLNPVMQYGIEKFCEHADKIGIDGIIIPDLPLKEYEEQYQNIFKKYSLSFIFLITPETSTERIRRIDKLSNSFIYMVSSSSTTGRTHDFAPAQIQYFERIQKLGLKNPKMIGFGISNKKTFAMATKYAEGAIIGSAFIKHIQKNGNDESIKEFLQKIRK